VAKIGLVAGYGKFPLKFAKAAQDRGHYVYAVGMVEETFKEIEDYATEVLWVSIGELNKIIEFFKKRNIKQVIMAGAVKKIRMFTGIKLDERWHKLLNSLETFSDEQLLSSLVKELSKENIEVLDSTTFLSDLLAPPGVLTKTEPTPQEWEDINYGKKIAKQLAGLDIGQTVVVKNRTVLSVEAIEGTDAAIKRGGELGSGSVIVVKVSRPNQDMRWDIPTVGLDTFNSLKKAKARVLMIEAGRTLVLDREELIKKCDEANIVLVSCRAD